MGFIDTINKMSDGLIRSKHWITKLTVLLTLYSLFFATPAFHYATEAFQNLGWQVVEKQIETDFVYQPGDYIPAVNQAAKKTFRLTVPLIAKVLHLNIVAIYVLQFLLGILFIYLVIQFVFRETNNRLIAALFAAGFVSLFVGRACFTDIYSRFEGWSYFFIFLTIYFRHWVLVFLFAFLASWTDERALIGLTLAFLWWVYKEHKLQNISFNDIGALVTKPYLSIVTAVVCYLLIRVYLQYGLGYYTSTSGVGVRTVLEDFEFFKFGLVTFLEGFWLLVFYKVYLLLKHRNYGFLTVNAFLLVAASLSPFLVFDITKSGSYIFLDAFISLAVINHYAGLVTTKTLTAYASGISILFPPYYIITDLNPYILQQKSIVVLFTEFLTRKYFW